MVNQGESVNKLWFAGRYQFITTKINLFVVFIGLSKFSYTVVCSCVLLCLFFFCHASCLFISNFLDNSFFLAKHTFLFNCFWQNLPMPISEWPSLFRNDHLPIWNVHSGTRFSDVVCSLVIHLRYVSFVYMEIDMMVLWADTYIWEGLWERSSSCSEGSYSRSKSEQIRCCSGWHCWTYAGGLCVLVCLYWRMWSSLWRFPEILCLNESVRTMSHSWGHSPS